MHLNEFVNMGGYGIYVWSAYSITLGVFAWNIVMTIRENFLAKKTVKQYLMSRHES